MIKSRVLPIKMLESLFDELKLDNNAREIGKAA
jgi:hypothetical protein